MEDMTCSLRTELPAPSPQQKGFSRKTVKTVGDGRGGLLCSESGFCQRKLISFSETGVLSDSFWFDST